MPGARNVRHWLNRGDILILDTETTGLDAAAEVIEIAIVDTTGRLVLSELSMPVGNISPQASAVNGLTRDVLIHELAREWGDIHDDVADALREASYVIAWNANFDERMLRQTAKRHRRRLPQVRWIDMIPVYRHLRPGRRYGLEPAMAQVGAARVGDAHRAESDCRAVLDIMRALVGGD